MDRQIINDPSGPATHRLSRIVDEFNTICVAHAPFAQISLLKNKQLTNATSNNWQKLKYCLDINYKLLLGAVDYNI